LEVHRNTVTVAYEELAAQEWVEILAEKGVFVHQKNPIIKGQ
jgi:DNA-binding transcriptional regulator YhcF (GntR family)